MARGDVLLSCTNRREEKGTRPAIAVQTDTIISPMLMVVPITSSLAALRFPFAVKIEPSTANGLNLVSIAMVFQLRAIDPKRIVRKIGELEPEYLSQIDAEIWQMLKPPDREKSEDEK
ncbi:MAG: type II toxin-antitoxin system PemK/MazF family toxin [Hydrococcus sp. Prado102]|jgi:mRNA interferase MazF|nr:type II toxin-antitoxin system PemK/MazF family toxin [Hydrococcus sp. Prado102]